MYVGETVVFFSLISPAFWDAFHHRVARLGLCIPNTHEVDFKEA